MDFFESQAELSVEDVLESPQWNQGSEIINHGYNNHHFWFKSQITVNNAGEGDWLLNIAYPLHDDISIYLISEQIERFDLGGKYAFNQRPLNHRHFIQPLNLQAGQYQLLIHLKTERSVYMPVSLERPRHFYAQQQVTLLGHGLYYGGLLVMMIFNLIIFLSSGYRPYLYYVSFVGSFALFQASLHGFGFQLLWPDSPWWQQHALSFFIGTTQFFLCIFSRSFLREKNQTHWYDNALSWLAWTYLIITLATLVMPISLGIKIPVALALPTSIIVFIAAIQRSRQGYRPAQIFLTAWTCLLLSLIYGVFTKFGLLNFKLSSDHAQMIGSFIELVLLTLALADRINFLQKARIEADKHAVEAEAESRAKSDFLATMSHEIRTPMNGVLGIIQLIQESTNQQERDQYLQILQQSGQALQDVIDPILDYSKLQANKIEVSLSHCDIRALIDECKLLFIAHARQKHLDFHTFIDDQVPQHIIVDTTQLKQVVNNLLGNAFKFTHQGFVNISLNYVNNELEIEIRDSGIGISAQQQKKIFEAFQQADRSTTREYGGTGLGLAICQQLVDIMQGGISISSQLNQGSCFTLRIPAKSILDDQENSRKNTNESFVVTEQDPLNKKELEQYCIALGLHHPPANTTPKWLLNTHNKQLNIENKSTKEQCNLPMPVSYIALRNAIALKRDDTVEKHQSKSIKILIAEDNKTNQIVIEAMLEKLGFGRIIIKENGLETLNYYKEHDDVDVILMDCEMPIMDGYTSAKAIRMFEQQDKRPAVKIIALSAHAYPEHKKHCLDSGMNSTLEKPIKKSLLEEVLG